MEIFNIDDISVLNAKTAVTVGMFDGVHLGHRQLLSRLIGLSSQKGLQPLVVTFENHPRQLLDPLTAPRLLNTRSERLSLLEACGVTNVALVRFDKSTADLSACSFVRRFLLDRLDMRMLLLGYDNTFGSRANNDFDRLPELAQECGFEIMRDEAVMLDGVEVSSTKIRKALETGDVEAAAAMLGRAFSLSGKVVHGRGIGRGLGFPTANIEAGDTSKIIPYDGVYALRVEVGGTSFPAMANLGGRPTFNETERVLEVHIIGFEGMLYDSSLKVEFLRRLRDIKSFDGSDALAAQMAVDRQEAVRVFEKMTTGRE